MEGVLNQRLCGGIKRIVVLPIGGLAVSRNNGVLSVGLPSSAVETCPEEGEAQCREERVVREGVGRIEHTLEFVVAFDHPMLPLLAASEEGLAAVVTLASGDSILLGYSSKFGVERPLRVEQMARVSGLCRADDAECKIRLWSEDSTFSECVNLL